MLKTLLSLVVVLLIQSCASKNTVKEKAFYGKEITTNKSIELDEVVKNYPDYAGKDVVVRANVSKVCAKKGCWMTLQGSDKTIRVKFHDYGFFVPMALVGKKVLIEGMVKKKEISIADTKHYLEDAGASKAEIAAVTKPSFEFRIVAKGVRVIK